MQGLAFPVRQSLEGRDNLGQDLGGQGRVGLTLFVAEQVGRIVLALTEEGDHVCDLGQAGDTRLQDLGQQSGVIGAAGKDVVELRLDQVEEIARGHFADVFGIEPGQLVVVEDRR